MALYYYYYKHIIIHNIWTDLSKVLQMSENDLQ